MDFFCAGPADQVDDAGSRRPADDAVIDDDDALAREDVGERVELEADAGFADSR